MFDKNLVHAIIGGKDLDCGSAELSVNLVLTRGHGSLLLDLYYFRAVGHPETSVLATVIDSRRSQLTMYRLQPSRMLHRE
jgi:hypothetical protein